MSPMKYNTQKILTRYHRGVVKKIFTFPYSYYGWIFIFGVIDDVKFLDYFCPLIKLAFLLLLLILLRLLLSPFLFYEIFL